MPGLQLLLPPDEGGHDRICYCRLVVVVPSRRFECRVRPAGYAWCQQRTFEPRNESRTRPSGSFDDSVQRLGLRELPGAVQDLLVRAVKAAATRRFQTANLTASIARAGAGARTRPAAQGR